MKILITGAFGFVGTNLSAYLAERGHELWALDVVNGQSAIGNENDSCQDAKAQKGAYSRCFGWEKLEKIPWGEVDAVVHLAGKAHDTRNASDPQSYFDVNVGLTKKVLEAWKDGEETTKDTKSTEGDAVVVSRQDAKAQRGESDNIPTFHDSNIPVKKFLLFSSVKAVADRVEGVLTEEALPDPKTPYGQSKLDAEGVVRSSLVHYCVSVLVGRAEDGGQRTEGGESVGNTQSAISNRQPATGNDSTHARMNSRTNELLYYILRPCMIHGPGNRGNLNLLYGVVRKGLPWPLGAFENRRSFASIGNVCAVVEGLLTKEAPAGIYQVADDETLSTNELIGLMARALGKRPRIWRVPAGLIRWVARCGDLLRLPLNSERLKKLTESYVVSNAKVKRALGWERMPVSARDGMRKTIESFSRQGAKSPSEETAPEGGERNDGE
ncbi:MAG TPA: NAD-dependent epimerase/dehydratase family protein [Kiritimatiellia bacterium]|nr:NAD-dependent epimerase/dehydratase family protein [Kiritimatiellia bacterium]HPS06930.1 NAD-dependent epimerase/dehydratase family protein [Kiritimatiellia bacterium]